MCDEENKKHKMDLVLINKAEHFRPENKRL